METTPQWSESYREVLRRTAEAEAQVRAVERRRALDDLQRSFVRDVPPPPHRPRSRPPG